MGFHVKIPLLTINERYNNMDTIDSIIINAQLLALLEVKNKVQDKIDELEKQKAKKEVDDEIPF